MKKYFCLVCKEWVDDIWNHVLEPTKAGGYFGFNKKHAKYGKKVMESGYKIPCFCGGHISFTATGQESYEITCDTCGFLWDED
jgi:hypothetical protein